MAVPVLQAAFSSGEIAPNLFGRTDVAKTHIAATTMRNLFVAYKGGAYSRPGTRFVGYSAQTTRNFPPRLVPFQFSINQGLVLEFGNFYMRVILNGAQVTETPVPISNVTSADPGVVTVNGTGLVTSATPVNTGVIASYAAGDQITVAGGVFTTPATLSVTDTLLLSCAVNHPGGIPNSYVPGNTITLAGGTSSVPAVVTVARTEVVGIPIIHNNGSGGTPGNQIVSGTTGTGRKFQLNVTISGGGNLSSINSVADPGSYTANPTSLFGEPLTGAGLVGASVDLVVNAGMGVQSISVSNGGNYTVNSATFTQASSSGTGTGATFQSGIFGPRDVTVSNPGVYTTNPTNPVSQASTTGTGIGAEFNLTFGSGGSGFNTGDWVFIEGVQGMTELNGQTFVINVLSPTTFQLFDVFGNPIDTTAFPAYTGGGTAARIFTLTTLYAEADLPWLKWTQSADVMTLCCVNQETGTEYPAQDLERLSDTDWVFTPVVAVPSIPPPASCSIVANGASGSESVNYAYCVTAVASDGTESIASPIGRLQSNVDIANVAGSVVISWAPVTGAAYYNIYKAEVSYGSGNPVPVGVPFGFIGIGFGASFVDSNIVSDFSQVPPLHEDPFARGRILSAPIDNQGSGFNFANVTVNTSTGSGAVIEAIINNGGVVSLLVVDNGKNYAPGDTISIVGDGTGATGHLVVGPQSGTYPGVVSYFQQRRVFGFTLNNPDTYNMSQPGAFLNFDVRIPTIASDAITGSPWSLEVNGIQFFVLMPAGLATFTGLSAWLLVGAGSFATNVQPISPSSQVANPLAFTGCSPLLPPIKINYDILYVTSKGSYYYDLPYQLYALSEPIDLTIFSSHLFDNYTMREHAWAEFPFKLLWVVRSDGSLLSCTFLKQQQVSGWTRHDTYGFFQSVASIAEPIIANVELGDAQNQKADAVYFAAQRTGKTGTPSFVPTEGAYIVERLDNRIWPTVEDCWCVDCAFTNARPTPNADLTVQYSNGVGILTGVTSLVGGQNYSAATTATVVDANGLGPGTGAVPVLTITGGVITGVSFSPGGTNYVYPQLVINDPENTGSGASATVVLNSSSAVYADAAIFSSANIGNVIRAGYGSMVVTAVTDTQNATVEVLSPLVQIIPNNPISPNKPITQEAGNWTMTAPISQLYLPQLVGFEVTGLADGQVIPPTVVPTNGIINLATPASAIIVGLGFQAQLQTTYLDAGEPTMQGQRKKIAEVTARIEQSAAFQIGSNQPDGSVQSPQELFTLWQNMAAGPTHAVAAYNAPFTPLFTGDVRIPISGGYNTRGQVALQQLNPLPLQVLDVVPEVLGGDEPNQKFPTRARGKNGGQQQ
jgi:Ubiquitin-activating enzyme E1 FCCH domain